jgi:hypothetical protein
MGKPKRAITAEEQEIRANAAGQQRAKRRADSEASQQQSENRAAEARRWHGD